MCLHVGPLILYNSTSFLAIAILIWFFVLYSLQDTFEKRSREASVEPATRPAEPYIPGEDDSRDEEEEDGQMDSALPEHLSGKANPEDDDDDDIA